MTKIALAMLVTILPACAQGWTPKTIVAITRYVPLASAAHIQGTVEVRCVIDKDGSVLKAEVLSGHLLLREQARLNALQWKFQRTSIDHVDHGDNTVILKYAYLLEGSRSDPRETTFLIDLPFSIQIIAPVQTVMYSSGVSAMRQ